MAELDDVKPGEDGKYEQAYVTRLRNQIAQLRTDNATVTAERDELKTFKDTTERTALEAKGEYEQARQKLVDENKKLEQKLANTETERVRDKISAEAKTAAITAGIIDAADAANIDVSDLRMADDGSVPGLQEKIAKLKETKPHWFKAEGEQSAGAPRPGASPGGNGGPKPGDNVDWAALSPEEFDKKLNGILTV